jgi:glutamate dehydrogenase
MSAPSSIRSVKVKRDGMGRLRELVDGKEAGTTADSMICVAFTRIADQSALSDIEAGTTRVLRNVAIAVADWPTMIKRLDESIAELWQHPPQAPREEIDESLAFLKWLKEHHFTFLGSRDYVFESNGGDEQLVPVAESGLGLLRDPERRVIRRGGDRAALTREVRAFLMQPSPLIVTKSIERSPVHRRVQEDYIGIKRFDPSGKLIGERRFVGLFTWRL